MEAIAMFLVWFAVALTAVAFMWLLFLFTVFMTKHIHMGIEQQKALEAMFDDDEEAEEPGETRH